MIADDKAGGSDGDGAAGSEEDAVGEDGGIGDEIDGPGVAKDNPAVLEVIGFDEAAVVTDGAGVDEGLVRLGESGCVVRGGSRAAKEDGVNGFEDAVVGEELKTGGHGRPDNPGRPDINHAGGSKKKVVVVGGDGDAGGVEEEAMGDGEVIVDDDGIAGAEALSAEDEVLLDRVRDGGEMSIGKQDVEMVGDGHNYVGDEIGPASAEEVDGAFWALEGTSDQVTGEDQAVGGAEIEINGGGLDMRTATGIEMIGGLKKEIVEAGDVGVGEIEVVVGDDFHAAGHVGEVLVGDITEEERSGGEDGFVSAPLVGDVASREESDGEGGWGSGSTEEDWRILDHKIVKGNVGRALTGQAIGKKLEISGDAELILDIDVVGGGAEEVGVFDNDVGIGEAGKGGEEIEVSFYQGIGVGEEDNGDKAV